MKASPTQIVLGLFVFLLAVITGVSRFSRTDLFSDPRARGSNSRFCIGISYPEKRGGLVCSNGKDMVMADAVHRLDIPGECTAVVLPGSLTPGDKVVLTEKQDRCVLDRIERLPGAHRLLTGQGLDINADSLEDLKLLPGIGEEKAKRIIETRQKQGPFNIPADLTRVNGIGKKTAERLTPWLVWPGP